MSIEPRSDFPEANKKVPDLNPAQGQGISLLSWLQYVLLGSAVLYFGKDVFIPIAFALLLSFILYPICVWLERKGLGKMIAITICVTLLMVLLLSLVALLTMQFFDFTKEWPALYQKFTASLQQFRSVLANSLGVSHEQQLIWLSRATDEAAGGLLSFIQGAISLSVVSMVMLILVPIYTVLILYYRHLWTTLLCHIFSGERESIREMLSLTVRTYYSFIKGMGIVYLSVGILNSIGLLFLGIPHAIFFGFVASVLTFIPYIGIMVGSLLPIAVAWLTYDSIWYPLGVVAIFTFVQYLEANVIFPFAVSSRLKVNTLVMLIAIFVGGLLWGVTGMILFVPFVGILKLIADHNPKLKTLAMALGTEADFQKHDKN